MFSKALKIAVLHQKWRKQGLGQEWGTCKNPRFRQFNVSTRFFPLWPQLRSLRTLICVLLKREGLCPRVQELLSDGTQQELKDIKLNSVR